MDYTEEREIRWETRFDSGNEAPFQVRWNRRIRNWL